MQRFRQQSGAEHLRRLRLPQAFARLGVGDALLGIGALQRVRHRHRQNAAHRVVAQFADHARQQMRRQTGPRRIVHQHPVVRIQFGCQQAVRHALCTCLPAAIQRRQFASAMRPVVTREIFIVRRQHHEHGLDVGAGTQSGKRVPDHGLTGQIEILLGQLVTHAGAETGGGD